MILTAENYFSNEASAEYLSNSQYKEFSGSLGMRGCEAKALAKIRGDWSEEPTTAMLVGSYVDAHFEGTLDVFKAQNPELFKKDGDLKAEYKHAEVVIARIERDEYFMRYLSGEKQVIFTAEMFGAKWKCKVDSFLRGVCIVDLKVMGDLRKAFWVKDYGHMSFIRYWGYDIAAALYQKIVHLNTGELFPFYIAGASKEPEPDIQIIGFTQKDLDDALAIVQPSIQRIIQIKNGEVEPDRCEECDYCRNTKVLTKPVHFSELVLSV